MRRRQTWLVVIVAVQLLWLAGLTFGSDLRAALEDRSRIPEENWAFIYYFGFEHLPPDVREETAKVLAFSVCSLNRSVVIEQQLPVQAGPVYRIDTRQLGWQKTLPKLLKADYPYTTHQGKLPLVIRADWFIQHAMDQEVSGQTYFELVFGEPIEKLDQFFAKLGAANGSPLEFGHIEDKSGVAVNRTRLLKTIPTNRRTDVWITFDSSVIDEDSDPLEHLDNSFKHDASEVIGALVKSANGVYGNLQVYALANAAGEIQTKAPADIVVDSTGVRGVEIRNPVSCVVCHTDPLRLPTVNALRQYIQSGAEAFASYDKQQEIERFHLTSLDKLIERHNEDYAAILAVVNGMKPAENAAAFKAVIQRYDAPLTLEQAAREVNTQPNDLKLAIARAGSVPARLAQLAHGVPISRSVWEQQYRRVGYYVQEWRNLTVPE